MTGRVFFPYKFSTAPTDTNLSDLDHKVALNCFGLIRHSAFATGALMYTGGSNQQKLSSVQSTDRLYIASHVHSDVSEFNIGSGDKKSLLTAAQMADLLESEGLTKSITDIEIFGCSAGVSFGKRKYIYELRSLQTYYDKLKKEKKQINHKLAHKTWFTEVDRRKRRLKVIDKELEKVEEKYDVVVSETALFDWLNINETEKKHYMLPLGAELCAELDKRGYKNVRVRAYVGQVQIVAGVKKIHYTDNGTNIMHFSDDTDHAMTSNDVRRPWNEASIEYYCP